MLILGIVFFVLEASITSYGLLAIGGVTEMPNSSLMLIKSDAEFLQLSWSVIVPVIITSTTVTLLIVGMGMKALGRRPETGQESMIGTIGIARTPLQPSGQLAIRGELWDAISDRPIEPGGAAQVLRVEGLTLYVTPLLQKKEA